MIPILFGLVILFLIGCISFCAVIGGYHHPEEMWSEGVDPDKFARLQDL